MHLKWKCIIANWINCYVYDNNNKNENPVNHESLLNIVYYLKENFNLDESKSSIFDGNSLEEFIIEKYPGFKFENSSAEITTEEEIYIAASLLLFFVCVNSKDVNIKSAMCSKLSTGDQEVILKYSKSLMRCHTISSHDVIAAIAEACGPDLSTGEGSCVQMAVAETPPALRSLHGEVRRLQAALDAERFDRNYLQDELARTNTRLEKLVKDRDQYKMEIMDLKAKITMCCGQEAESRGDEAKNNELIKLSKQLEHMEERVVYVQEQLDEALHERDTYKNKLEDLKGEVERLVVLSQEEGTRANHLAEELETEKRQSQTLRELVLELRQHNHRNGFDSSLLECDDPDTSVQSLHRSFSVCSEACANVVEVQLGEERAKCLALKQQIQSIQEQMDEQIQKAENLQRTITDRENDIFNLKHRINEEIEEKSNLKSYFDSEVTKLNNVVNELEQKIKDNNKHSTSVIENKMQEIQTLQEEKLSLLNSLSDETTKCENMIKELKSEIDVEKSTRMKMRDDYENIVMKMKEKVLNRNNELVELQNNILQKSELIEQLNLELRKERELKDQTINNFNKELELMQAQKSSVENELHSKCLEAAELVKQLQQRDAYIDEIIKELDYFKMSTSNLKEDCRILEENKRSLLDDIQNRQISSDKLRKEIDNLKQQHIEEKDMLQCKYEEMCAMVKSLQTQLQNEIDFKMEVQCELEKTQGVITKLSNTNTKLNAEINEVSGKMNEKEEVIKTCNLEFSRKEELMAILQRDYDLRKMEFEQLNTKVLQQEKSIEEYEVQLTVLKNALQEEKTEHNKKVEAHNQDLTVFKEEKHKLEELIKSLHNDNAELVQKFNKKCETITQMESERNNLSQKMEEKGATIHNLEQKLNDKMLAFIEIENNFELEISKLINKLSDNEKTSKEIIMHQELQIQALNGDIFQLKGVIETNNREKAKLETERKCFEETIKNLKGDTDKLKNGYNSKLLILEESLEKLKCEVVSKNKQIDNENNNKNILSATLLEKENEISGLQVKNIELINKQKNMEDKLVNQDQKMQEILSEQKIMSSNLNEKLKQKEHVISVMEEKQRNCDVNIHCFEADKASKQKFIEELQGEINALKNSSKEMEIKIVNLTEERNKLQSEGAVLKKNSQETTNKVTCLKDENDKLLNLVEEKQLVIEKLQKEQQSLLNDKLSVCQILEHEKLKYRSDYDDVKEKYSNIVVQFDKQSFELTKCNDKINDYSKQITDLKATNDEKDQSLADLKNNVIMLESEKLILTEEITSNIRTIKKLQETIAVLEMEELPSLKEDNLNLKNVVEENKTVITNLEKRIEDELGQNIKQRQSTDAEILTLSEECRQLKGNVDETNRCLEQRDVEIENLQKEIGRLTSEAELCEEELKENNMKLIKANNEKHREIYELLRKLDEMKAAAHEKDELIKEREKIIGHLNERLSAMETLTEELNVVKAEKVEFIKCLEIKEQVIANLENELENSNKLRVNTDSKVLSLSNECRVLKEKLNEAKHGLEERSIQFDDLKTEMEDISSKANIYEEELKHKNEALVETNKEMEAKVQEFNQELDKIKVVLIQNEKEIDEKEGTICELKQKLNVFEKVLEELQKIKNEKEELIEFIEKNKRVIANLEEELEKNIKLRQITDSETLTLSKECRLLEEKLDEVTRVLQQRNVECNNLKIEIEVLASNVKQREEELKEVNMKFVKTIDKRDIKIHELTQELDKVKAVVLEHEKTIKSKEDTISDLNDKLSVIEKLSDELEIVKKEKEQYIEHVGKKEQELASLQIENDECKIKYDALEVEFASKNNALQQALEKQLENNKKLESDVQSQTQIALESREKLQALDLTLTKLQTDKACQDKMVKELENKLVALENVKTSIQSENSVLLTEKNDTLTRINILQNELDLAKNHNARLTEENLNLASTLETNKSMIVTLEKKIHEEQERNDLVCKEHASSKHELIVKCDVLQENLQRLETELNQRNVKLETSQNDILKIKSEAINQEEKLRLKNEELAKIIREKEGIIQKINEELAKEVLLHVQYQKEADLKDQNIRELQNILKQDKHAHDVLLNENKILTKQIAEIESHVASNKEKISGQQSHVAVEKHDDLYTQVDCIHSTNISQSSTDSNKTIRDLEIILNDKNRIITSLQIDIKFMKSLMAESENKVLDLTKDLEISQENCQQLSIQLKKILHQKNDEIAELKSKISKMSVMENRASQIIKVSAKYQDIIHKRIAEIKSNTVLKELTNFGNGANCENDLKRSLNSGTITMEELENFLETTERHIWRCTEKRIALQKERDRLLEVNKINESEIIGVRKFLAELSVSVKTFNSVRELYTQRLSRVVSLQRTVRREILSVEGRLAEGAACRLERGYAAAVQDLAECAMQLERWVERSLGRAISAERIKQAFSSESERASVSAGSFQNASLEAQMEQLAGTFERLLEESARALRGEPRDAPSATVHEVRAEYEEKLSRMKTKMKELYHKEMQSFKEAQREEVMMLQQKLQSTREELEKARKNYEDEIRSLNVELWNLGEKYLNKTDEANWLRRKQRSESLMSLQHVPTSGFCAQMEDPCKASDTHSLRSLPVNINTKKENRGLHMSDEEGEVFDNRFLRELTTPKKPRLSELQWRNSLCPPHLKSSYPAETQFAPALHEEDIKAGPTAASLGGRQQRKEVGITAYKKPGPPTPSKQAGRLSATDSELRESLRVEAEPQPRKTATPSKLRLFFSSARNDTVEGTPRSRRLSNLFRKK